MDDGTAALDLLAVDLAAAPVRVGKAAAKVVRDVAAKIETTAKKLAPVDTTRLKESIDHRLYGDGRESTMNATIGTQVPYAHIVEYGRVGAGPRPFLGPALDAHREDFTDRIADTIGQTL